MLRQLRDVCLFPYGRFLMLVEIPLRVSWVRTCRVAVEIHFLISAWLLDENILLYQ